ncbi:glycoprotein [Xinjiang tick rhabdovirus]|uniref:Glycoprotein n=1 Tax=Xinjiang tick rhabdovirus TaxID=2560016 RepID=A0A482LZW4_9RHAB|nr:glycoprotein [Xinjiang tick rhabdovirus]QBQ65045.1 glycoprotein [Xinjiang tick rhabdovirus]
MLCLILLLTFSSLSPSVSLHDVLGFFPDVYTGWVKAKPGDLKCASSFLPLPKNQLLIEHTTVQVQSSHHELVPVIGQMCMGLRYVTHCSEGFFGTKTITKRIEKVTPTSRNCLDAIEIRRDGHSIPPYFPAESCVWMSEDEAKKDFFVLIDHTVKFDPYKVGFSDSLLLDDICTSMVCKTEHENTLWISPIDPLQHCSIFLNEHVLLYTNQSNPNEHWVRVKEIFFYKLNGSCQMSYCGKAGLRLGNGMFFGGFPPQLTSEYPHCPTDTEIKIASQTTELEILEEEMQEDRDRMNCLSALTQMLLTNKTTYLLLSFMDPRRPGVHPVYRLHNNSLEMAMARWVPFIKFNLNYLDDTIGVTLANETLKFKSWVPSGTPGAWSGYNGVHKLVNRKEIIYPRKNILEMEYENSLMIQHELKPIEHPHIIHLKREGLNNSLEVLVSHNKVNVGQWLASVWDSAWGKVTAIVTTVILIVVGYFVLKLVISCCGKCKEKKNNKSGGAESRIQIEMLPLRQTRAYDPFSP